MARQPKKMWIREWLYRQRKEHGYSNAKKLLVALETAGIHIAYSDYASYESPTPASKPIENKPALLKRIAAFYRVPLPKEPPGPTQASLIVALGAQTAALNRLVDWLESLAPEAIREGVAEAVRAAAESRSAQPPGQRP